MKRYLVGHTSDARQRWQACQNHGLDWWVQGTARQVYVARMGPGGHRGDGQPCGTRTSRGRRVATTASPGPLPENVTTQVSRLVSIPLIHGKTPNATKRYPHKAYPIGTRSYVLLASTRYYPVRGSGKHMRKIPFCGAPLRSTETMQSRIPMAKVTA